MPSDWYQADLAPAFGSGDKHLLAEQVVVETEAEEGPEAGQVVGSDRDADSDHRIVDVWQAGDVGVGCDGDHDYVEAAVAVAAAAVVDVDVAAVEENTVEEGPLLVVDVDTQEAAAGQPSVEGLEEHTVVGSQRTVDTGCTVVEVVVVVVVVEPRGVAAEKLVVEDDYVSVASACLHHSRSLHTRHFVREVALVAGEESMREYKLRSPVAVVAVELQPSKRNNLEGRWAVDLEGAEVGAGCTSAAV